MNPPRIVTMSWAPASPVATVALVGKGITFDSGGLNIKPSTGMVTMKCDMAGAAAVAATVLAVAELGLPVAVTGYLCLAENMPSGSAQRPSDVVVMRDGTSVEILDTDAEGRMVLGDGLCLASEKSPDWVVDIATLTGAQVVALGTEIAGVMGNDDAFRDRVVDAAGTAGEGAWPMPLPVELRAKLDTPTADIAHKGDRDGGMLTAGLFLKEFVGEGIPWAHVDIAGPAFSTTGPKGHVPKGGTGFGVGTLLALVESVGGLIPAEVSRRSCGGTSAGWPTSPDRGHGRPWCAPRGRRRRHRRATSWRPGRHGTSPSRRRRPAGAASSSLTSVVLSEAFGVGPTLADPRRRLHLVTGARPAQRDSGRRCRAVHSRILRGYPVRFTS